MEIVLLDAQRDGIEQISQTLAGHSDLSAVHFVTHGANAIVIEKKFTTQLDTPQHSVGVNQQNDPRSVTAVAIRVKNL